MHLLLATNNAAKVDEMRAMLIDVRFCFHTLSEFTGIQRVNETGSTYQENAAIKARSYARQTGLWALADDSGLEVTALAGAPGVCSARFAGSSASDDARIALLLSELKKKGQTDREATFISVTALADSTGSLVTVTSGSCKGQIIDVPRGQYGFGYDPIFVPKGLDRTFSELTPEVKNLISHRAMSLQAMNRFLKELLGRVDEEL